jgi:hypothetical protein
VALEDEPTERLALVACPGFVARASSPAPTSPSVARTASARFVTPARCRADSIRDNST